jgi:hypothetical protein
MMKMKNIFGGTILILSMVFLFAFNSAYAGKCSDCHPSILKEPFRVKPLPVIDPMSIFYSPCNDYNKVMEEYYNTRSFFTTIEINYEYLEAKRVEVADFRRNMSQIRAAFREFEASPVISSADFKRRAGGLRYEMGKTYSEIRLFKIDLAGRNVFGVIVVGTLFIMLMLIIGWRIASGPAEVHPPHPEIVKGHKPEAEVK